MSTISPHRKIPYHHHHVMRHKPQSLPSREPGLLEQEVADTLLANCIKTICEEMALKQGITEALIDTVALESMRAMADAFMLRFLSHVRRSMLAARRIYPTATDFDLAIEEYNVPRPDDQLRPYKTNPQTNPPLYPTPPPEDEFHNLVKLPASFLGPDLDGHGEVKKYSFALKSLPELPSAHTFKASPVYPQRESDTRKIRELATHEGKLGEQALRKLAGAVKLDAALALETEASLKQNRTATSRQQRRKRWRTGIDLSEEAVFEETLRDLLAKEPKGFELGPIVTCEKAYRMPDDVAVKRKAPPAKDSSGAKGQGGTTADGDDVAMEL